MGSGEEVAAETQEEEVTVLVEKRVVEVGGSAEAWEVVALGAAVGTVAMRCLHLRHGKTCRTGNRSGNNGASVACTNLNRI